MIAKTEPKREKQQLDFKIKNWSGKTPSTKNKKVRYRQKKKQIIYSKQDTYSTCIKNSQNLFKLWKNTISWG